MRETIVGTLNRKQTRKADRNWVRDWFRMVAEEAGMLPVRYWRERVFVADALEDVDAANISARPLIWSATRRPNAFAGIPDGARVRFTALVQRWDNGLGGQIKNIRDVEVLALPEPVTKGA